MNGLVKAQPFGQTAGGRGLSNCCTIRAHSAGVNTGTGPKYPSAWKRSTSVMSYRCGNANAMYSPE
jgi:hypothetical protein